MAVAKLNPSRNDGVSLSNQDKGRLGEEIARRVLLDQGYKILATNWTSRYGEIDLIAFLGDRVIFVEVKYRYGKRFGGAKQAIDMRKYARLQGLALLWLQEQGLSGQKFRIDAFILEEEYTGKCRYQHWEGIE